MGKHEEVALVVGTRPEIIKMAPVIRAVLRSDKLDLRLIHSNQHYDSTMSEAFFESLKLPFPNENLEIERGSHAVQTASGMIKVEEILADEPDVILGQGDTNTVLSTALAAAKSTVPFGHVEAGIRSFDRTMPEEVNRVVADNVCDFAFAPTETAVQNLKNEGITKNVYKTGNTIVDACLEHREIADKKSTVLDDFDLQKHEYVAVTVHRPKNTDDRERFSRILTALDNTDVPVVFPAHPRAKQALDDVGFTPSATFDVVEPLDYLDFLKLEQYARVIVTDSGGIQEEASILEVPCLTVRPNTERPETIEAGVNELVPPEKLQERLQHLCSDASLRESMTGHPDLYGTGDAGTRICTILEESL